MRTLAFLVTLILLIGIAACVDTVPNDTGDDDLQDGGGSENDDSGGDGDGSGDGSGGDGSTDPVCGDGICEGSESSSTCAADCMQNTDPEDPDPEDPVPEDPVPREDLIDLSSAYAEDGYRGTGGFDAASPVSGAWDGSIDGSDSTSPGGPVRLVWIRFDLGSIHDLSQVRFYPDTTGTRISERYYIERWDGSEWVNFITNEQTLEERWYEHDVDVSARHVRITVESDSGGTQFRELELIGHDTNDAGEPFGTAPECTDDSGCASNEACTNGACVASEDDPQPPPEGTRTITYTADTTTDFGNPERGWYTENVYWGGSPGGDSFPDPVADVTDDDKPRLELYYVNLGPYASGELTQPLFDEMESTFEAARTAGVKLILRYAYNRDGGAYDPQLSRMQTHMRQLAPYWEDNQDVIAVLQAGFSGSWGEMWDGNIDTLSEKRAFIETLMDNTPEDMMVQWRDPGLWTMYTHPPANRQDRFDGSDVQRMGHYNDCFLAGYEMVTYWNNEDHSTQDQFDYVESMAPYVAMGGESCDAYGRNEYNDGDYAIERMEAMDWDYLNSEYWMDMYAKWQESGDLAQISRSLGYRLVLEEATIPEGAARGETVSISLTMRNDGFGKVYNPRPIDLILDGPVERTVRLDADARRELPLGGEQRTLTYAFTVPSDLPSGTYDLALSLPDPSDRLEDESAYAIRLANVGMWNADGTNDLNARITIG